MDLVRMVLSLFAGFSSSSEIIDRGEGGIVIRGIV
jgi:hypothetical protein